MRSIIRKPQPLVLCRVLASITAVELPQVVLPALALVVPQILPTDWVYISNIVSPASNSVATSIATITL